jgi:hypothetical protein
MSFLDRVSSGIQPQPPRLLLYGTEGIGKTSFGASMPAPIFIDAEGGSAHVNAARAQGVTSYGALMEVIGGLYTEEHPFQTLVVDTVDWLEGLINAETIRRHPVTSKGKAVRHLRDYGWGDGYVYARGIWSEFLEGCDALREHRGMSICLLAHYKVKTVSAPDLDDYQCYTLSMGSDRITELLIQWADAVLFARDKVATRQSEDRTRAVNTGERVLCTTRRATHDAKNRYSLPDEIPFDRQAWATLSSHIQNYYTRS